MPLGDEPPLDELIAAVRNDDPRADLAGAVRRSGDQNFVLETMEWIWCLS